MSNCARDLIQQDILHMQYYALNLKPNIVYLQGKWKNNPDNMELQNDTGNIVLIYYEKSVNIVAGGKGEGIVSNYLLLIQLILLKGNNWRTNRKWCCFTTIRPK